MILCLKDILRAESLRDIFVEMGREGEIRVHVIDDTTVVRVVEKDHVVILQE